MFRAGELLNAVDGADGHTDLAAGAAVGIDNGFRPTFTGLRRGTGGHEDNPAQARGGQAVGAGDFKRAATSWLTSFPSAAPATFPMTYFMIGP